eukprot:CAMPEP_0182798616 /NCGR_PEP_ID=MMETSP0006_2-20121128/1442_1 /TAXON_ID=97485 /ORGANISM="Prymnesium parvum, Strain Texoma1" /LENGTH=177 /DNA_ID=CAMNT_0024923739 /DNA_START=628 /DNA_END=1160 /DNA_ORIENTATION=-
MSCIPAVVSHSCRAASRMMAVATFDLRRWTLSGILRSAVFERSAAEIAIVATCGLVQDIAPDAPQRRTSSPNPPLESTWAQQGDPRDVVEVDGGGPPLIIATWRKAARTIPSVRAFALELAEPTPLPRPLPLPLPLLPRCAGDLSPARSPFSSTSSGSLPSVVSGWRTCVITGGGIW